MAGIRWTSLIAAAVLVSALAVDSPRSEVAAAQPRAPADACPPFSGQWDLDSVETVEDLLVGVWVRCDGGPIPGSALDDVGLEVTADLEFHRLYDVDGALVRARGVQQEGDIAVHDLTEMNGPGSYQVDWQLLGGGIWTEFADFWDVPVVMRFENGDAIYVRDDGATPVEGTIPDLGGTCGVLDDQVTLGPDELRTALVGVWLRCDGPPVLGLEESEVGIELTAEGTAHRIYRDGAGGLVRAYGAGHSGSWTIVDDAQLDIDVDGSGTFIAQAMLFDQPQRALRLLGMTGPIDLRRWDGPPPLDRPVPIDVACGGLADRITPTSAAEASELFVGVWIPCAGAAGPDGQVAIEIAADGRWYRIYRGDGGELIRTDGYLQEGTWRVSGDDGTGRYGFGFTALTGGSFGVAPEFYASPSPAMWLDLGVVMFPSGAYLRWEGAPPVFGTPPGPAPVCGRFRSPVDVTSAEQAASLLVGTWTLCGTDSLLGPAPPGEVGIEFLADGRFFVLVRQPDGTVIRGSGPNDAGTWTDVATEPPYAQLSLGYPGDRGSFANGFFFDDPSSVVFQTMTAPVRYVRGAPPVTPVSLPPTGGSVDITLIAGVIATLLGATAVTLAAARRR